MPEASSVDDKVYECTCPDGIHRRLSMMDLLSQFNRKEYMRDGVSRISDLHLKTNSPPYFRVDNEMIPWSELPSDRMDEQTVHRLISGLVPPERRGAFDAGADFDIAFNIPGLAFRVNVFRDRVGLCAAIRVLPATIIELEAIGFPDPRVWHNIVNLRQGLVMLTGITGSGKSTTIASLVQRINETRREHIITLEDPIEYIFTNQRSVISQRQVGREVTCFSEGLRSILREDPDVIVIGEMRDRETIANALTAAETGHLVFTTMHTRDAKGAISRITDMFPESRRDEVAAQLSHSLTYVIAQKLITQSDGKGRLVAMEILRNTPAVSNLIRQMSIAQIYSAMQIGSNEEMCTMERTLARLVTEGKVTEEEAGHWANVPEAFMSLMQHTNGEKK